ncbi:MAG TPA: amidohydrolase family protein [Candidatus Acidoferrales bacterium]|nr:amidohydrolase family protein [Candidatus Acidoferrales bacterium]
MQGEQTLSRRTFVALAGAGLARAAEPVIDIHQHTNYSGRTDEQLIAHQRTMGIAKSVLLPAGSTGGLAAGAGGNDTVVAISRRLPGEYKFFANELPDIPETRKVLEKFLKAGAIGIGEQKFHVECDSKSMQLVASIAAHHGVPVLMHFQHETYNLGFERFHKMLEKFPKVNFIGHAQTWWGNIDKNHQQAVMYPKGPVTGGGITDRLLTDYPNVYGDLSAGSGLNALLRDEDHAREFLKRHQDRLIYGSDCSDHDGAGQTCSGSQQLAAIRRLAPDDAAVRKMLSLNAARVMKI